MNRRTRRPEGPRARPALVPIVLVISLFSLFVAFLLYALSGPVTWVFGRPKARRKRAEPPIAKVENLR
jgi:hypothetical protein